MIPIGNIRSHEVMEYKDKIMNEIRGSGELRKLLGCEDEASIPYRYSFPHEYIPETSTGTERYINFDIGTAVDPANNTFRNVTVYFYILSHEAAAIYEEGGQTFLWFDRAACELEQILCGKNILGIGRTVLSSNEPYCPHKKWKGRLLKFTTKDFSNG